MIREKINNLQIAIIGATGVVGREAINILERRELQPKSIKLAASSKSAGQKVTFFGKDIAIQELNRDFFEDVDIAIASAGSSISREFIQPSVSGDTIVIDNCSFHRLDPGVPLVIPEGKRFRTQPKT